MLEKDIITLEEEIKNLKSQKSISDERLAIISKERLLKSNSDITNSLRIQSYNIELSKKKFVFICLNQLENEDPKLYHNFVEICFEINEKSKLVNALEMAIKATEETIIEYHKRMMDQINSIISDLWDETYEGKDIQKIEIKSEVEGFASKKSSNFNYRIVFQNHRGKETDMRGRCSMGQKVLASIIIRLALAEAFGLNCGVFALDEPTTNLDKDHISSLSRQVQRIIEYRRQISNFQMIIISHDKDFISSLSEYAEGYIKISKDSKTRFSIAKSASFH